MPKRKPILSPLYADDSTAGNGGGGAGQTPGVADHSAAAQALAAQQAADTAAKTGDGDDGKGGKAAVLADLHKERQSRQALEQQVQELKTAQDNQLKAFKAALGLGDDGAKTPEQLQATLAQQQSEHQEAMTKLTVHQLAKDAGGDPVKLLDSVRFLSSIKGIAATDTAAISTAIEAAVKADKTLAPVTPGAGSKDAATPGGQGSGAPTFNDALRALVKG